MPSHVRWFFWLSVALVAYSACSVAMFVISPHYADVFAGLPPVYRAAPLRETTITILAATAFWAVIVLMQAWLAAFQRQNWARWTFAGLFVFRHWLPFATAAAMHRLADRVHAYFQPANWTDPLAYAPTVLTLAAIVFVFTGDARAWFAKRATAVA